VRRRSEAPEGGAVNRWALTLITLGLLTGLVLTFLLLDWLVSIGVPWWALAAAWPVYWIALAIRCDLAAQKRKGGHK
jgi:predicted membrane metal-binding protein